MDWDTDISSLAQTWMKFLGDFGPTVNEQSRELKGYMHDDEGGGKVYLDAGELRELAAACNEVADWLDKRANTVPNVLGNRRCAASSRSVRVDRRVSQHG